MRQQVNLYQEQFKKLVVRLSAKQILVVIAVFAVFMLGYSAYLQNHVSDLRAKKLYLSADITQLKSRVTVLEAQLSDSNKSVRLDKNIRSLRNKITSRKKLLQFVEARGVHQGEGLSEYLTALSRQHIKGIWLTDIKVTKGGSDLVLHGSALKADLVPMFIAKLHEEDSYEGREFKRLSITRAEKDTRKLDFVLSSNAESQK
ncbi:MAG: hypothetical protein JKY93_07890 [Gammaproteobacteria bacterium]|nr:hypothetical protein [Gammaproteobacteria bacterium]